jgi:hypothetical protein
LLALAGLVLALAACASSGSSRGSAGSTTSSPDPAVRADRVLARAVALRASDLPGWSVRPRTGSASGLRRQARGVPGCEPFVAGIRDGRVQVRSPRFSRAGTTVAGAVDVYATPVALQAQLELYRDPAIVGCLQGVYTRALRATAPAGATVGTVSVSPVAVDAPGDGTFGFRLTAELARDGTPQTVLSDLVGVAVGRVGASLTVTAGDTAGLAQAESTLLPVLARRMEAATR